MMAGISLAEAIAFFGAFTLSYTILARLNRWAARRSMIRKTGRISRNGGLKSEPYRTGNSSFVMARQLGRLAMPKKEKDLSAMMKKLIYAGFRHPDVMAVFYGIRISLGCLFTLLFLIFPILMGGFAVRHLVLLFIPFSVGYYLPYLVLKQRIKYRQNRIFTELPDTLDLLTICLKAGLGFDYALYRVCRELRLIAPVLSHEFGLYFLETKSGLPRETALNNLERRNPSRSLKNVVAVLLQSARSGTDMADALKVYTDSMRTERRQKAEEAAGKLSTKMTLPLVLFILPALMLIVLGPSIINFVTIVKKGF